MLTWPTGSSLTGTWKEEENLRWIELPELLNIFNISESLGIDFSWFCVAEELVLPPWKVSTCREWWWKWFRWEAGGWREPTWSVDCSPSGLQEERWASLNLWETAPPGKENGWRKEKARETYLEDKNCCGQFQLFLLLQRAAEKKKICPRQDDIGEKAPSQVGVGDVHFS